MLGEKFIPLSVDSKKGEYGERVKMYHFGIVCYRYHSIFYVCEERERENQLTFGVDQ